MYKKLNLIFILGKQHFITLNTIRNYYNKSFFLQTLDCLPYSHFNCSMGKKNKSLSSKFSKNNQTQQIVIGADKIQKPEVKKNNDPQPNEMSKINYTNSQNKLVNNPTQQTKQIKKSQKPQKQPSKQNKQPQTKLTNAPQQPQVKGKQWSQLQYQLRNQIIESLKKCNFNTMLPVQEASIPLLLKNYDLAVEAQTGSGKTLSFLIPLLEKYLSMNVTNLRKNQSAESEDTKQFRPAIKYLVVSPTRELCQQTFNVLVKLLQNLPSSQRSQKYIKYCHCATGGSDMTTDIEKLKQSTVVFVGTVGRIRELSQHMDQNWLKKVEYLFIDEADRVLKEKGIEQLIRSVQKIRRTAMFSATLQTLNQKNYDFYGMRNLAKISLKQTNNTPNTANNSSTLNNDDKKYIIPKSLTNTYLKLSSRVQKMEFLTNFLINHIQSNKVIVFFNTCASVDFYTKLFNAYFDLKEQEDQIVGLHGKLKTKRRQKLIKTFLSKKNGCLFATDVVSRGIDFDHIHFIVQVDPPEDPDNYVHRIGRTARINRPGTAILLIQDHEEAFINYLAEKSVGVQQITNLTTYYSNNKQDIQQISRINEKMDEIMRTDRDFVQKSKKAFVSYIRSYKEHDLRYIFQFKNVDIGKTALSFFMYRIPRIKQILGKSIASFTQSPMDIQTIPWLDKNQQLQYLKKKEKREEQLIEKKKMQRKLMKNADAKNNKSKRKRIKAKMENKILNNLNKEHRQLLKSKTAGSKTSKHKEDQFDDDSSVNDSENTEQIEQRIEDQNITKANNNYSNQVKNRQAIKNGEKKAK